MFSGNALVVYLRFLPVFRKVCNGSEVSEPNSLKIWPFFFPGNVRDLFDHNTKDARINLGCFCSYLSAVQFFLRISARDEYLEEPDEKLIGMKHITTEDVQHYLNRLTKPQESLLAHAHSRN